MKHKFAILLVAVTLGLLAVAPRAQADPLLDPNSNNQLNFSDAENLYDGVTGAYIGGNSQPMVGNILVGIFEVTANQTNMWAQDPHKVFGQRDTYYGVTAEKIMAITPNGSGGVTITFTPLSVGDPTVFTGGGNGDATSFSTVGVLDYTQHDQLAFFHQGGTPADAILPDYSTTVGTVASQWATATEGSKYLTLDNNGPNYYSFSTGTTPPGDFALTNFSGLYIDVNNTGFTSFKQIADHNVAGGGKPVPFYLESKINFNVNGQFGGGSSASDWDFQSADPANVEPLTTPAPAGVILLVIGGMSLLAASRVRRRRKVGSV